jgi:TRAP-type mannitol/chloroaromatic compound transport system substrate-binding protein
MKRRILMSAAAAAAPVALAAPAVAQTQNPEVRWRLASSFPRTLDILYGGCENIARRVAQLTDNRFQIRCFPAGEIVPALQTLDAAQAGTIEATQTAAYYYVGKEPSFAFYTAIPWGLNVRQMTAWLRHGGGQTLADELLRDYNCIGIPGGETGAQMGGWWRKEIRSVADLQGVKFRIGGLAGQVFAKLGVSPTQIAGGDIYPSLERGVIDAAEWVGPYDDEKLGFARVAQYYYAPGFWEGSSRNFIVINSRAYEALPDFYKQALRVACAEGELEMAARYDAANPAALRRLVAAGAQLRFFPRDVLQALWRASHEVYEEIGARDPRFKKTWESYRPFRDEQYQWFRVAENSFENFAFTAAAAPR